MLEILIGIISGIVSGSGMGGGTILILCLSLFLGIDQHIAQATNLIFFIPVSITVIFVNIKQKLINWKDSIPIIIAGVIGAIAGAKISINMEVQTLKKYFGIFLAIIAIHEIYSFYKLYINDKKRNNKKEY